MDAVMSLIIALGLAMDSFSVSIANGLTTTQPKFSLALKMGVAFGFFQGFMAIMGWLGGISILDIISGIDHWVAFGLLGFIGCKMMYEALWGEKSKQEGRSLNGYLLFMQSVATSIDALAVGVSLAFLRTLIFFPVMLIAAVSFALSFLGVYIGNKFGRILGRKIEVVGGLILICIGIKILAEHML
ncbi:manganese efflux pump [Candidatus Bathyarchaeota archaeon]|nr:MAG: manganese efflux pump [Candidatus Bathyarchaeota archaeon]